MRTATKIKDLKGFTGEAALFKVSPPLEKNSYVVVSATSAMFSGPETYIFPATKTGKVKSWVELDGSYKGGLSMEKALSNAGYSVKEAV